MLKRVLHILAGIATILITVVVVDMLFGLFADSLFKGGKVGKSAYGLNVRTDAELLFAGSSRASHHYDTPFLNDSLGWKSLNLGMDGRGLTYHYPVIESYLKNNQPNIVVLELLPSDLSGILNSRISSLYPYADSEESIKDVAIKIDPRSRFYLKSNLYRYNSILFSEMKDYLHPYTITSLGYEPLPPNNNPYLKEIEREKFKGVDSVALYCLESIVNLCRKKEIKLVVTYSPEFSKGYTQSEVEKYCKEHDVLFIDNRDFRLPEVANRYFNDEAHMNSHGAREYTKYFAGQLDSILKIDNVKNKDVDINNIIGSQVK